MGVEAREGAVLVCTTANVVFGPLFDDADEADEFLGYISHHYKGKDARLFTAEELAEAQQKFREDMKAGAWPIEEEEEEEEESIMEMMSKMKQLSDQILGGGQ
tara:strand:- start:312 stop:620 length:309 start_codon:yes stop_codon:yes gene_type:complete